MRTATAMLVLLIVASGFSYVASVGQVATPAPTEGGPGEHEDHQRLRDEWIESLHTHAPGLDWRLQDGEFRRDQMAEKTRELARWGDLSAVPANSLLQVSTRAISGQWVERGSGNVAGRTMATQFDVANNRLSVLSHGGHLWRADRATLNWSSPGDGFSFTPRGANGFLERLTGGERLIVLAFAPSGVFYSDNGGTSWTAATGAGPQQFGQISGLVVRDPANAEIYALSTAFDGTVSAIRPRLYASTNRGTAFTDLGFIGQYDRVAIFSPRYNSSTVFLLDGLALKTITPGTHALVNVGTVTGAAALGTGDRVSLSGGVDSIGNTFLYAFIVRNGASTTEVYRSINGGSTWVARTPAPNAMFGLNSAESSTRDPNQVYLGGINAYRSSDGAQTWEVVNIWSTYYGNEATNLHADITNFDVFVDGANNERVFVSTDGGTYESTNGLLTVQNLSLAGLRNAQYYGSYTVRASPNQILAGSQDQGYQKALMPGAGVNNFVQTISGDYGYLTSGSNGGNLWMVYPGFVLLDTAPQIGGQNELRYWYFPASLQGWRFLTPLEADPLNPSRSVLLGGGFGANRFRLITLTYNGGSISHSEGSFDFGGTITAMQFSPDGLTRYVIKQNGQFYRDTGSGFSLRSNAMPGGSAFGGRRILVHPTTPGTIYVGGSGYSNPGVYRSVNNGDSFTALSNGLPSTLVYDLAISPDGERLFAATELGPYYYDTTAASWVPISAVQTPAQAYWDVDYIDELETVRFSTYGRGIWDFVTGEPPMFRNSFEG